MGRRHDFMELYHAWGRLAPGPRAELRRISHPNQLMTVPAFYRLFSGRGATEREKEAYQRLIFCLPCIKRHTDEKISLGKALGRARDDSRTKVSEMRMFQVVRSVAPNDMIQLRRILKMVEPIVNWELTAAQLWFWNERSKRDLLEQYFLNQSN